MLHINDYIVPTEDPKNLARLIDTIHPISAYRLFQTRSKHYEGPAEIYRMRGRGRIIERNGGPALYSHRPKEWHVTSWIVKWYHAPDHIYVWQFPEFLREKYGVDRREIISKVIVIETENSTYELRYDPEDVDE